MSDGDGPVSFVAVRLESCLFEKIDKSVEPNFGDKNLEDISRAGHVNRAFVFHVPTDAITQPGVLLLQGVVPRFACRQSTEQKIHRKNRDAIHF